MKKSIFLILSMIFAILNYSYSQLDSNKTDKQIISISQFQMFGQPNIGDTIRMQVEFTSLINGQVLLGTIFNDKVFQVGGLSGEIFHLDSLILDSGQYYIRNYQFIVLQQGISDIRFLCRVINPIPEYEVLTYKSISFKSDLTNGYFFIPPYSDADVERINFNEIYEGLGTTGGDQTFHIEGNVKYFDWWDTPTADKPTFPEMRIWFKRNNYNPYYDFRLFHPINPVNGYIEGVHYAKCDKEGNFVFDFIVPNGGINQNDNLEIWIMACKGNESLEIYSGSEHKKINLLNTTNGLTKRCFLYDYEMKKLTVDPNTNIHSYNFRNTPIRINDADGQIIRYTTIGRNFVLARFNNNLPWNAGLPKINTYRITEYYASGTYSSKEIQLKNLKKYIIYHEYGHYVHHAMSNFNCSSWCGSRDKTEGFARFFGSAVAAWDSHIATYNELFEVDKSSENRPFDYSNGHRFSWNPNNSTPIEQIEFDCYLWNVYDSYNDFDFIPNEFNGYNNDDVSGLGADLFNKFFEYADNESEPWIFHRDYKATISDAKLQESIQKIKDCMAVGDVPLNQVPPMRPAQVKEVSSIINHQNNCFTLNWDSQSYTNTNWQFRNLETGYKVSCNGTELASLSYGTNSYTTEDVGSFDGKIFQYKVTSYNSTSGESFDPIFFTFDFRPLKIPVISDVIEENNTLNIELYPNPVNNSFNVNMKLQKVSEVRIDLYSLELNYVAQLYNSRSVENEVSTYVQLNKNIPNGTYFIRISIDNKEQHLKKFIKFVVIH